MHSSEERTKRIRKLIRGNNQVEVCKVMVVVKVEVVMVVVKAEVVMVEVVECNHQTGLIPEVSSNSHILMQDHQTPIQ